MFLASRDSPFRTYHKIIVCLQFFYRPLIYLFSGSVSAGGCQLYRNTPRYLPRSTAMCTYIYTGPYSPLQPKALSFKQCGYASDHVIVNKMLLIPESKSVMQNESLSDIFQLLKLLFSSKGFLLFLFLSFRSTTVLHLITQLQANMERVMM